MPRSTRRNSICHALIALASMSCLTLAVAASAQEVVIDNGGAPPNPANVIDSDNSGVDFVVQESTAGDPTEVEIVAGGSTAALTVRDFSVVTVAGGSVGGLLLADHSSTVTMTSGALDDGLRAESLSTLTLAGGAVAGSVVNFGLLTLSGSALSGNFLATRASYTTMSSGSVDQGLVASARASVVITGGTISGDVVAVDSSWVTVSGGSLADDVIVGGDARLTIRGGSVGTRVFCRDTAVLEVIGTDFEIDGAPVPHGQVVAISGVLTGTLESGDAISSAFSRDPDTSVLLSPTSTPPAAEIEEDVKLLAVDSLLDPGLQRSEILFGTSVALEGTVALVGAPGALGNARASGAAYVFRFDGATWAEEAKLMASPAWDNEKFGVSVALSGDTALVGAPNDWIGHPEKGSAFVYRYDGSTWLEEAKLTAPFWYADFGYSVALDGDVALVGAPRELGNEPTAGAAYVFRYDGSSWVEEAKLVASDGIEDDGFGVSIALSGDAALVGSCARRWGGQRQGAAYVFRYDGTTWVEEAKLERSGGDVLGEFGCGVALDGDTAMVQDISDDDYGTSSGAVHVYRHDGVAWAEEQRLTTSDAAAHDYFGHWVSIEGDIAVIGAPYDNTLPSAVGGGYRSTGSAYVFHYDGSSWVEREKLVASVGEFANQAGSAIGFASAVSGDTVLVGAPADRTLAVFSGAAYIFSLPEKAVPEGKQPKCVRRRRGGQMQPFDSAERQHGSRPEFRCRKVKKGHRNAGHQRERGGESQRERGRTSRR